LGKKRNRKGFNFTLEIPVFYIRRRAFSIEGLTREIWGWKDIMKEPKFGNSRVFVSKKKRRKGLK
jgi:hypothetical protein